MDFGVDTFGYGILRSRRTTFVDTIFVCCSIWNHWVLLDSNWCVSGDFVQCSLIQRQFKSKDLQSHEPETIDKWSNSSASNKIKRRTISIRIERKANSADRWVIQKEYIEAHKRSNERKVENETKKMPHLGCCFFCIGIEDDAVVVAVVHERSSELAAVNSLDTILNTAKNLLKQCCSCSHAYHKRFYAIFVLSHDWRRKKSTFPNSMEWDFKIKEFCQQMENCHFNQMLFSKSEHFFSIFPSPFVVKSPKKNTELLIRCAFLKSKRNFGAVFFLFKVNHWQQNGGSVQTVYKSQHAAQSLISIIVH